MGVNVYRLEPKQTTEGAVLALVPVAQGVTPEDPDADPVTQGEQVIQATATEPGRYVAVKAGAMLQRDVVPEPQALVLVKPGVSQTATQ